MKKILYAEIDDVSFEVENLDDDEVLFGINLQVPETETPIIYIGDYWIRLFEPGGIAKLNQLLHYTNADTIEGLKRKVIRVVIKNGSFYAFGHEKENSFFKLNGKFAVVTEEQI